MLIDDEIAYIAGVLDARGHIRTEQRHGAPAPRVRVTTRRHELLAWLALRTGTQVVVDNRGYERKPCGQHCTERHQHMVRQSAAWNIDSSRATIVLAAVRPFIVCQVAEVEAALTAGLARYPPTRGDVPTQMRNLGWPLPAPPRAETTSGGLSA